MPGPGYLSDAEWLPSADVVDQTSATGEANLARADRCRRAAAAHVERVRPDLATVVITAEATTVEYAATPDVVEGAVLYAARLYARKGSPSGLASFGDFSASLPRLDADIERLLGLGRYARPVAS